MRRTLLVTTCLLAVALAGCFGSDGGGSNNPPVEGACEMGDAACEPQRNETAIEDFELPLQDHYCVQNRIEPRVHAPDLEGVPWVLGQTWTFARVIDGEALPDSKLVYYDIQDGGAHYMIGTTTREEALDHALFSTNPLIGRIHKNLYSPHESGSHADMFNFPLCDGNRWTTVFFGEAFALEAVHEPALALPDGSTGEGFRIEGTSDAGSVMSLSYSLDAQWFTYLRVERADSTPEAPLGVQLELVAVTGGHTGEAFFLRGQQDEVVAFGDPILVEESVTVPRDDGAEGAYDSIAIHIEVQSDANGVARVRVLDPAGESVFDGLSLDAEPLQTTLEVPYQAGDWAVEATTIPPAVDPLPVGLTLHGEVRFVSIYDRSGSVA